MLAIEIKPENLPKELGDIKNAEVFDKFLENVHANSVILSDGEPKLYIWQNGDGGMIPGSFRPVFNGVVGKGGSIQPTQIGGRVDIGKSSHVAITTDPKGRSVNIGGHIEFRK